MARFAFAFSATAKLTSTRYGVGVGDLVRLGNGDVLVRARNPVWILTAERTQFGDIQVTGGSGFSEFRYSIDDGVTWIYDVSPSLIENNGEVLFQAIGEEQRTTTDGILAQMAQTGQWQDSIGSVNFVWRDTDVWDDNTDKLFNAVTVYTNGQPGDICGTITPLPDGGSVTYTLVNDYSNMFAINGSTVVLGTTPPVRGVYNCIATANNASGWSWSVPCRIVIF